MSTSRNGLRYLWVPGRKRHNRKGKIESTNKNVDYSVRQKKNEQWTLGGSKTVEKLMKDDEHGTGIAAAGVVAGYSAHMLSGKKDDTTIFKINEAEAQPEEVYCNGHTTKSNKKKQNRNKSNSTDVQNDEAIVKCLYYTLNLCECSIS